MPTLAAQPIPPNGLRELSKKEALLRARALNCTVDESNLPSCAGQLYIGMFFDGTSNNLEADYTLPPVSQRKHSNIVKLFQVYNANEGNRFRYYIPGVGTRFPQIGDEGAALGAPFAWNGEDRITWGLTRIFNAANRFVNNVDLINDSQARTIAKNMASSFTPPSLRRTILRTWQNNLKAAIAGKKPEIKQINLSVFGFSRGAAEARAFSNWLFEVCDYTKGEWQFAGIPLRLDFLGIYDTVASVGIPNSLPNLILEGHQSWADGNMHINPAIEQCVHLVAGHEVRAAFPLDSVRTRGVYPANAVEVMYPGAHSDLGGGYAPGEVGIAPTQADFLCAIPALRMYNESRKAGVPIKPWGRLSPRERSDFTPAEHTVRSYNEYVRAANIKTGPVEELHRQHMSLYLSYRYKYRNDPASLPFYTAASRKHKSYILITSDTFNQRLRNLHTYHIDPSVPHDDAKLFKPSEDGYYIDPSSKDYSLSESLRRRRNYIDKGYPRTKALESKTSLFSVLSTLDPAKLTPEMEHFFGHYVHDSMAGFVEMSPAVTNEFRLNGEGILRYRKIFTEDG